MDPGFREAPFTDKRRSMLEVSMIPALKDNYIYVLHRTGSSECLVIDPGESAGVQDYLGKEKLKVLAILNTHHHWDHTDGNQELKKQNSAPIYCSEYDLQRIDAADYALSEGSNQIGNFEFEVIAVPGHTLGHIALYFSSDDLLFTGDCLFSFGCGRLFEGTPVQMQASLQKLAALPDKTLMYCGHEYTLANLQFVKSLQSDPELDQLEEQTLDRIRRTNSSLPSRMEVEKKWNPFLRAKSSEELAELRQRKDRF